MTQQSSSPRFIVRTTVLHVVTYFIVGMLAAIALNYEALFEAPVIRDYMQPFGTGSLFIGPVVQVLRGVIAAVVLLRFRAVLRDRLGWLWLWLLLVGIGILSTSAAAPSSIEGVVYTQLPLWYHAIGLPEMLVQTLIFSALVALYERHPGGILTVLPPVFDRLLRAVVVTTVAFVGYAIISVTFALVAGAAISADESLSLEVQGVFLVPLLANGAIAFHAGRRSPGARQRIIAGLVSYGIGVAAIAGYQAVVTGGPNLAYALVAPLLPALIVSLFIGFGHSKPSIPRPTAHVDTEVSSERARMEATLRPPRVKLRHPAG